MKINLDAPVLDYEDKPITTPPDEEGATKPLTFFDVFVNALNGIGPGEQLPAETKNKIYQITRKIYLNKEPNLTPDQLILIKERVGKAYAPVVVGRVIDLIDGTDDPKTSDASAKN